MRLDNLAIKNAKPGPKNRRLPGGEGLFLEITPRGKKYWRFRYRFQKKENLLSLGVYPDIPLKRAREKRLEMRRLLADGIDPAEEKRAQKLFGEGGPNSFEAVAREWIERNRASWSKATFKKLIGILERDIFPGIGEIALDEIKAPKLLQVLRLIEKRGAIETAHTARSRCAQIFRYAIATGRAKTNPADPLRGALTPIKRKHLPSVIEPKEVGHILRIIDNYEGGGSSSALPFAWPPWFSFVRVNSARQNGKT